MTKYYIRKIDGDAEGAAKFLTYDSVNSEIYVEDFVSSEPLNTGYFNYGVLYAYSYDTTTYTSYEETYDIQSGIRLCSSGCPSSLYNNILKLKIRTTLDPRPLARFREVDWSSGGTVYDWTPSVYETFKDKIIGSINRMTNSSGTPPNEWEGVNVVLLLNQRLIDAPLGYDYKHNIVLFYEGNDPNADEVIEV